MCMDYSLFLAGIELQLKKQNQLKMLEMMQNIACDKFNIGEMTQEDLSEFLDKQVETINQIYKGGE